MIKEYDFNPLYADKYTVDKYITTERGMFELATDFVFKSTEQTIDSGKMCVVAIDSGIEKESVVVE